MAIDFTMSAEQRKIQKMARDFSEGILAPVIPAADKEPDPMLAYQKTKGAYIEAYKAGIAMAMLPKEYGGGGCLASISSSPPKRSARSIPGSPVPSCAMVSA